MLEEYGNRFITKYDSPLAAYVDERVPDSIQPDRECFNNSGESLALIGKRLLKHDADGSVSIEKFDSPADAEKEYELYEFPSEWDNMLCEQSRGGYYVTMEGTEVGTYDTRDEAEFALAQAMVDAGVFGDSWLIDERGGYDRIDDAIRAYHDEGGDKMHPRFKYMDDMYPHYVQAMLWSTTDNTEDENDDSSFLDNGYDIDDIESDLEESSREDIRNFVTECWEDLKDMDPAQAGHDFWLTREGHGAGFWDRGLGERGERLTKACKPYGSQDIYSSHGEVCKG